MIEVLLYGLLILATVLAAGFLLYLFRGRMVENRLVLLDAMADLSQRIQQLEHAVHANATAAVERKLDGMSERIKELDGRVAVALAGAPPARGSSGHIPDEPEDERRRVEQVLAGLGYSKIRIVADAGQEHSGDRPHEYRVEVAKGDLLLKGSVFVTNGAVGETRLAPIYELFP